MLSTVREAPVAQFNIQQDKQVPTCTKLSTACLILWPSPWLSLCRSRFFRPTAATTALVGGKQIESAVGALTNSSGLQPLLQLWLEEHRLKVAWKPLSLTNTQRNLKKQRELESQARCVKRGLKVGCRVKVQIGAEETLLWICLVIPHDEQVWGRLPSGSFDHVSATWYCCHRNLKRKYTSKNQSWRISSPPAPCSHRKS